MASHAEEGRVVIQSEPQLLGNGSLSPLAERLDFAPGRKLRRAGNRPRAGAAISPGRNSKPRARYRRNTSARLCGRVKALFAAPACVAVEVTANSAKTTTITKLPELSWSDPGSWDLYGVQRSPNIGVVRCVAWRFSGRWSPNFSCIASIAGVSVWCDLG
jgi:hypothetical protein